jgi:branched-subunit amino acid aminotransferase/4-amino-4-deoxychorismate lyase
MVEVAKARVAPVSPATLYGRGVFTTVAIYKGLPFLWSAHWRRLKDHADRLGIDCSGFSELSLCQALKRLVSVNGVVDGRARVIFLARGGRDMWTKSPSSKTTDLLIMTADQQKIPERGLALAVSPYRFSTLSPLAGIKSLNYLDQVLSWEEAQRRDFDEAVMLNERGEIVSATMANIFWVKDGKVFTPSPIAGALPGVTREAVIGVAGKHSIPLLEGVYELSDLTEADEIFLTSASLGVAIVTTFDFRQYSVATGSVAARLRDAFSDLVVKNS